MIQILFLYQQDSSYSGPLEIIVSFLNYYDNIKNKLVCKDFYLAFSPEREEPCNPVYSTEKIPKVVGGYDNT